MAPRGELPVRGEGAAGADRGRRVLPRRCLDADRAARAGRALRAHGDDVAGANVNLGADDNDFLFIIGDADPLVFPNGSLGAGFILDGGAGIGDTVQVDINEIDTDSNGFELNTWLNWDTVILGGSGAASSPIEFSVGGNLPGVNLIIFEEDPEVSVQLDDMASGTTIVFEDGDLGAGDDWVNALTLDVNAGLDTVLNLEVNAEVFLDTFDPKVLTLEDVKPPQHHEFRWRRHRP